MNYNEFKLVKIEEVTYGVRIFSFEGDVPPYKPGNFFLIRLAGEDGTKIFRPFSSATHPSEHGLRFCVKKHTNASLAMEGAPASFAPMKKNSTFTELLWKLRVGNTTEIDGPYGIFTLDENDGERVFIAGGTGIAPLRSMIMQTILEEKRAHLFHSASNLSSLIYSDEMQLYEEKNQNFRFFPAVTREEMPHDWQGIHGRLTVETIAQKLGTLSGKTFYLCGPKEMIASLVKGLEASGVHKEKIKKEEWG